MAGTARDPDEHQGRGASPPWPPGVLPLLGLYALVQVIDGFSIGMPQGFGAAMLRGPWIAARTLPFLFLLTVNRRGDGPLALATGLAAGQIFCSAYVDTLTRALLRAPERFALAEAVVSCLAPLLVALLLWRREGSLAGNFQKFALRGLTAAAVLITISFGPIATMVFTAMMLLPIGQRWR